MKVFQIHVCDLTKDPQYMHDHKTGKHDLLGQIFHQLGYNVPPKTRMPHELGTIIPPFTIKIRNKIVPSPSCMEILRVSKLNPREQISAANKILEKYRIQLEEAPPPSKEEPLPPENQDEVPDTADDFESPF